MNQHIRLEASGAHAAVLVLRTSSSGTSSSSSSSSETWLRLSRLSSPDVVDDASSAPGGLRQSSETYSDVWSCVRSSGACSLLESKP
jgi:hypothetical protein